MVELTLVGVRIELPTQTPIVLLKERDGERFLPIWIGNVEAPPSPSAPAWPPSGRSPTTCSRTCWTSWCLLERIVITELKEGTFYATIELRRTAPSSRCRAAERRHRPRVRANTPIFAEEDVLSEASILIKSDDERREVEKFREFLDQVSPEDSSRSGWFHPQLKVETSQVDNGEVASLTRHTATPRLDVTSL